MNIAKHNMEHSLKDLLAGAIQRANISREVTAAQIVLEANRFFEKRLGPTRRKDIRAVSYRDGTVTLGCLNSPAAQYVSQLETEMRSHISAVLPSSSITNIQTRVMKSFPASEL